MTQFLNPAGLFQADEDINDDGVLEAQSQGHVYIDLELNPKHVRGGRLEPEVRFSGVMIAKVFEDGIDDSGLPKVVTKIKGDAIKFLLYPHERKWKGKLLDHPYNRKFLRSHMGDPNEYDENHGWIPGDKFKIVDEGIRKEVEAIEPIYKKDNDGKVTEEIIGWKDPYEQEQMDENEKLKEKIERMEGEIKDLKSPPEIDKTSEAVNQVADSMRKNNADNKTDDNAPAAGGKRMEPDRRQGNSASSKRRPEHPVKEGV